MGVWPLVYEEFDPGRQGLREALYTLGNGYFATRGALPEAEADGVNYPATYVAGLYNRLRTDIAGRTVENEDLVNVPNWLPLSFRVAGGEWFDVRNVDLLEHHQELDMHRGLLIRQLRWEDGEGRRTRLTQRWFVHLVDMHLAGLESTFEAENWSGILEVRSGLDGRVVNAGVQRYKDLDNRHLEVVRSGAANEEAAGRPVRRGRPGVGTPGHVPRRARSRPWGALPRPLRPARDPGRCDPGRPSPRSGATGRPGRAGRPARRPGGWQLRCSPGGQDVFGGGPHTPRPRPRSTRSMGRSRSAQPCAPWPPGTGWRSSRGSSSGSSRQLSTVTRLTPCARW